MSYSFFRFIGSVTRNVSVASVVANLAVMWLIIFSGFVLSRGMRLRVNTHHTFFDHKK